MLKTQNKKVLILLMILRVLHKKKEKQVLRRNLKTEELPRGNTFRRSWDFFLRINRNILRSLSWMNRKELITEALLPLLVREKFSRGLSL